MKQTIKEECAQIALNPNQGVDTWASVKSFPRHADLLIDHTIHANWKLKAFWKEYTV